jgi:hypothetical protein
MFTRTHVGIVLLMIGVGSLGVSARAAQAERRCKLIHGSMVEERATDACKPGHAVCFLGEVTGNHGFRANTYFHSDGSGSPPTTSPDFVPYSGVFEYHTRRGTLIMRETGVTNPTVGNPESGAVTAFQKITEATGDLVGTTGYFFVSGFSRNGRVETNVTGEVCFP